MQLKSLPPWVLLWVVDPLERAGRTFVQQWLAFMLIGQTGTLLITQHFAASTDAAVWSALVALFTSYASLLLGVNTHGYADVARRLLLTFVQSVLGTMVAGSTHSVLHTTWTAAILTACYATAGAAVTALAALGLPGTAGASIVVPVGVQPAHSADSDQSPGIVPPDFDWNAGYDEQIRVQAPERLEILGVRKQV